MGCGASTQRRQPTPRPRSTGEPPRPRRVNSNPANPTAAVPLQRTKQANSTPAERPQTTSKPGRRRSETTGKAIAWVRPTRSTVYRTSSQVR